MKYFVSCAQIQHRVPTAYDSIFGRDVIRDRQLLGA